MTEVVTDLGGTDKETVKMNMTRVFELEYALSQVSCRLSLNLKVVQFLAIATLLERFSFINGLIHTKLFSLALSFTSLMCVVY